MKTTLRELGVIDVTSLNKMIKELRKHKYQSPVTVGDGIILGKLQCLNEIKDFLIPATALAAIAFDEGEKSVRGLIEFQNFNIHGELQEFLTTEIDLELRAIHCKTEDEFYRICNKYNMKGNWKLYKERSCINLPEKILSDIQCNNRKYKDSKQEI